jgi:hypothetical protein
VDKFQLKTKKTIFLKSYLAPVFINNDLNDINGHS